jgi:hypothetical protein
MIYLSFPWQHQYLRLIIILLCTISTLQQIQINSKISDFSNVADTGNYTCDELTRWLGTEKHYSNEKKEDLFSLLEGKKCFQNIAPVIFLENMNFGHTAHKGRRMFYQTPSGEKGNSCIIKDKYSVAFLSNFSINNNFSHFLHSLLRLFCALIDSKWLVWDENLAKFKPKVEYTIWLDEYFKASAEKLIWLEALGGTVRQMGKILSKGSCAYTEHLLYGSGCVKLLPPEKWFGYPHCR